jgi:acetoin utilization deacetylase AcuC-like enzyme
MMRPGLNVMAPCRVVGEALPGVLASFQPDLVLYDAGVDPHREDLLGKLELTDAGLMRRELQVGALLRPLVQPAIGLLVQML